MKILHFILWLPIRVLETLAVVVIIPFYHGIDTTLDEIRDIWSDR